MYEEQHPEKKETAETQKKENEFKGTKCEVYSRVVGYIRPVNQWNEGKQEEFRDREEFKLS